MWNNKLKEKNKSFTLIELMIVMVIISVGIAGVANLTYQIILYTRTLSSKLIASYLAQEGMEIVRNIRDTNWLEDVAWDQGIGVGNQQADWADQSLSSDAGQPLKFGGGVYNYNAGPVTKFYRRITVQKPGADEMQVLVTVYWAEMSHSFEVSAFGKLYNWRWW